MFLPHIRHLPEIPHQQVFEGLLQHLLLLLCGTGKVSSSQKDRNGTLSTFPALDLSSSVSATPSSVTSSVLLAFTP